jgi:hypothetical protein
MKQFLLRAEILLAKDTLKGITAPQRLTLSDGKMTHDAVFQSVNETNEIMELHGDETELQFRNSYHFYIAAYELARMLGVVGMVPIAVER